MNSLDFVRNWYADLAPEVVVEFQPDDGYFSQQLRPRHRGYWYGVETWAPHVEESDLWEFYDKIIVSDIRHLDFDSIYAIPDLVILGDVIPHLAPEESVVVLNRVKVWADAIIVSAPISEAPHHRQGNWTYGHQSSPTLVDVSRMMGPGVEKAVAGDGMMYFLWKAD